MEERTAGEGVQRLADWIAIRELTARVGRAFDDGRAVDWAGCFTDDAVFEVVGRLRLEGASALREFAAAAPYGSVHITTDHVIEIDGDRALQTCTLISARRSEDRGPVAFGGTGRYTDELVRTPAGWRFAHRSCTLDGGA